MIFAKPSGFHRTERAGFMFLVIANSGDLDPSLNNMAMIAERDADIAVKHSLAGFKPFNCYSGILRAKSLIRPVCAGKRQSYA